MLIKTTINILELGKSQAEKNIRISTSYNKNYNDTFIFKYIYHSLI